MKKIGIFFNGKLKKNAGGPSGYLYNLKIGIENNNIPVDFIVSRSMPPVVDDKTSNNKSISIKMPMAVLDFRMALSFIFKGVKVRNHLKQLVNEYDFLHAHSSEDIFALKKLLKYKGKIVFTPHRPESLANEVIVTQKVMNNTKYPFPILRLTCRFLEVYSYKHADAFIFPSINAKEIYKLFPGFQKNSTGKPIQYVYTGTNDVGNLVECGKYRKLVDNYKKSAKIISYVGRHNYIKGYDLLVETYERMNEANVFYLCAGAKSTLEYPLAENWIELGYIYDSNCLMKDSDIVVIPNRNTYFDLVIVEALSVGTIVITSNTGGNLDIAEEAQGLILFEAGNCDSLISKIEFVLKKDKGELDTMKESNRDFYKKYCKIERFAESYYTAIKSLVKSLEEV